MGALEPFIKKGYNLSNTQFGIPRMILAYIGRLFVCVVCVCVSVCDYLCLCVSQIYIYVYAHHFPGLTYTLYSIPNIVLPALGGVFLTKVGTGPGAVILVGIQCVGTALVAISSASGSYPLLLAGRLLFGIGSESSYVAQNSMCVRWFAKGKLASAMSVTVTLGRVGSVLVFNTLPVVAERTGSFQVALWVAFFVVLSSLGATLLYVLLNLRAERLERESDPAGAAAAAAAAAAKEEGALGFGFKQLAQFNVSYWVLLVLVVAFYSSVFPFSAIATQKFTEHFHISASLASRYTSIVIFTSMLGAPVFGMIADRYQESIPVICAIGVYTVLPAYLLLAFTAVTPWVPMLILGLAFSIFPSASWPSFSVIVPHEVNATAFGVVTAAQNAMLALFNFVTGVVADK
jgi:MFS family permease